MNPNKHDLKNLAGKPISLAEYKKLYEGSIDRTWASGHLTASSFKQTEMNFQKGHVFYRIAKSAETDFRDSTFVVNSKEDFNRYLASSFGHIKGTKPVVMSFSAKDDIRIPSLHTSLETMRMALESESNGAKVSPQEVMRYFNGYTGTDFTSGPITKKFVSLLKDNGYHGIIDHADAGVRAESPLVLFSPDRLTEKVAKFITETDYAEAASSLTEITNRK